jgi:hypothetical protein
MTRILSASSDLLGKHCYVNARYLDGPKVGKIIECCGDHVYFRCVCGSESNISFRVVSFEEIYLLSDEEYLQYCMED